MKILRPVIVGSMMVILMSVLATSGWAEDGHGREGDDHRGGAYMYGHDRGDGYRGFWRGDDGEREGDGFRGYGGRDWRGYYPSPGYIESELPRGYMTFDYDDSRYYYGGGIWYSDTGSGFMVVTPPYGIVVPVLPPYYTTTWVGGVPYYGANGVYYVWQPDQQGYVVSALPAGAKATTQASDPDQLYVYPEKGQSASLQAKDRYQCHRWAVGQTGFDPSQPAGDLTGSQLVTKRDDYRRAIEACLDARGYSVK